MGTWAPIILQPTYLHRKLDLKNDNRRSEYHPIYRNSFECFNGMDKRALQFCSRVWICGYKFNYQLNDYCLFLFFSFFLQRLYLLFLQPFVFLVEEFPHSLEHTNQKHKWNKLSTYCFKILSSSLVTNSNPWRASNPHNICCALITRPIP